MRIVTTLGLIALMTLAVGLSACDAWKDAFNEAAAREESFEEKLDDMPLVGVGGACPPELLTFDLLLSEIDWWADAKGHLRDLAIERLDYRIEKNDTPADVTVRIYLTTVTDINLVTEEDFLGVTELVPAETEVDEWTPLQVTDDAEERLTDLVMHSETEFAICAKIPEVDEGTVAAEDVNLRLGFQVAATATFVPLKD